MPDNSTPNMPATTPRILLVNFHSAQNAGDLSLLEMNLKQLRAGFQSPAFLILANNPAEDELKHIPDAQAMPSPFAIAGANTGTPILRQVWRLLVGIMTAILYRYRRPGQSSPPRTSPWGKLIEAVAQADLVVGVSGNYFLSMGKYGWPFPLTIFPVWAANLLRKPYYALPQSIGPFRRGWEKFIFRRLYRPARKIYLRDQVSMDLARELKLPANRVQFSPDPAFLQPAESREAAVQILQKYGYAAGQAAVGITVIAPLARVLSAQVIEKYYRDLAAALERFTRQYAARVFIFSQVTGPTAREDDRTAGRMLLSLLPSGQTQVVLVDEVLNPAQLKACYACMELMVASRLHSGIFAMGTGVATLSIGYFTKSRGLMRAMGLEDWLLELGKAGEVQIYQKLCAAWEQRKSLAAAVQKKVALFAQEVMQVGPEIQRDFVQAQGGLRVVQLVKGLEVGGVNGGSDVFGLNLAGALKRQGTDTRLVVFYRMNTPTEKRYLEQMAAQNVPVEFLQSWQGSTSLRSYLAGWKRLASYVRREQIHVLHSHFQIGTAMAAWLRLTRQIDRAARTAHVDREWERGWEGPFQQALIRFFIFILFPMLIDLECGVSQASIDVLNARWAARLIGKRARKVYNAIPAPDLSQLRQEAQLAGQPKQDGCFLIGTVGRMTEQKGHTYLLDAAAEVLRAVPEARFCWVGDGPLRAELEAKATRLGIRESIAFTGLRHDVDDLLDTMDLFVLPSIYEGLPTVILESMARGVPVIGTNIPGTREIIRHGQNGWLVPPRTPRALAEAIINAVRSPHERIRIAQGALATLSEFSIERSAEMYLRFYRGLFQ